MSRRVPRRKGGQRFGGRAAGGGAAQAVGINGWNGTARYEEANAGPPGTTTMSRVVVFRLTGITGGNQSLIGRGSEPTAARGWVIDINASTTLRGIVTSVTPAAVVTPTYTLVAGDVDKILVLFLVLAAGTVRLYQQTATVVAEIGTGTACVGYTAPAAGDDFMIGNNQAVNRPAAQTRILSAAGSDTAAWTLPEMQAIADSIRANAGRIETATPSEIFRYNANDVTPPGTWTADAGSNLAAAGSDTGLLNKVSFTPVFR